MAGLCSPLPTLRRVLANANARLGVDVDRYTFIVVDLHHLLLAGLPAHFESYMPSHAVGLSASEAAEEPKKPPGDAPCL
jgi:hypothetical protein